MALNIYALAVITWFRASVSKGAFLLSELAGQTHQFAKKMQQFEGTLA